MLTWSFARLDRMTGELAVPAPSSVAVYTPTRPEFLRRRTPEQHHAAIEDAKEQIRAGEAFQIVLSQRFEAPFELPPFALYRALRRVNPAPFLCYLDFEAFQIVCSSPEILVRLRDGKVTIRPIAGTRPRGATPAADEALADELLADPKERAEHLMLLDLGRNDVGPGQLGGQPGRRVLGATDRGGGQHQHALPLAGAGSWLACRSVHARHPPILRRTPRVPP